MCLKLPNHVDHLIHLYFYWLISILLIINWWKLLMIWCQTLTETLIYDFFVIFPRHSIGCGIRVWYSDFKILVSVQIVCVWLMITKKICHLLIKLYMMGVPQDSVIGPFCYTITIILVSYQISYHIYIYIYFK